ncbi:MAG: hypothetical protein ACFBSC_18470 [Microcoleaceae cyanobacterium]
MSHVRGHPGYRANRPASSSASGGEIIPIFVLFALFLIWGDKPKKEEKKPDPWQPIKRITIDERKRQ